MNQKLKLFLDCAVNEEDYFYNFYLNLAERSQKPEIKEALKRLAEQERLHKEKLQVLNKLTNESIIAEKMESINIHEDVELRPIEDFKDLVEMFKFAIEQEVKSRQMYLQMAEAIKDEDVKKLLVMLAEEEKGHEQFLVEELESLS